MVFTQHGFRGAAMRQIAEQAGMSRALIYQYFADKEDVFRAMAASLHEHTLLSARQAIAQHRAVEARLFAALEARMLWFYRRLQTSRHGMELLTEGHRLTRDLIENAVTRFLQILASVLREAEAAGEIALERSSLTPRGAAELLVFSAAGLSLPPDGVTPEEYAVRLRRLVEIFVRGLRPDDDARRDRA